MLRVLLPPNLAAAAARNAVAVKIEFEPAQHPDPAIQPAFAWIERQTGAPPRSPLFLQLTRAQLREFIGLTEDLPVFFWVNRPAEALAWDDGLLRGASEHLDEPPPSAAPAPAPPAEPPRFHRPAPGAVRPSEPLLVNGSEHFLAFTLPAREHPAYDDILKLVKNNGFVLETSNRRWWLRDRHKTLNFLAAHWTRLREQFGARFTPNFERNTARLRLANVICSTAETADGYDLTVALQAGRASEDAVRASLASSRSYVEDAGEIALLPAAVVDRMAEVQRRLSGEPSIPLAPRRTIRIARSATAEAEGLLESLSSHLARTTPPRSAASVARRGGVGSADLAGVDADPHRGSLAGPAAQAVEGHPARGLLGGERHRVLEVDQYRIGSGVERLGHTVPAISGNVEKRAEQRGGRHGRQFLTNARWGRGSLGIIRRHAVLRVWRSRRQELRIGARSTPTAYQWRRRASVAATTGRWRLARHWR